MTPVCRLTSALAPRSRPPLRGWLRPGGLRRRWGPRRGTTITICRRPGNRAGRYAVAIRQPLASPPPPRLWAGKHLFFVWVLVTPAAPLRAASLFILMLRIAIQKSGRLSEDSLKLIRECGISFVSSSYKLKVEASNFPLEILYLRDDDIPGYVQDGVADLGIVGQNVLVEAGCAALEVEALGFSKCRLSLAVPRGADYNSVADLQGKSIATSYPKLLGDYLAGEGVRANLHTISGSVEIAPSIGLAEAICDIVSSGSTLLGNGLREVETIFRSEAVLIAAPNLSHEKQELLDQLRFRMQAVAE
jgi:ATP phosphoribosyltransferase